MIGRALARAGKGPLVAVRAEPLAQRALSSVPFRRTLASRDKAFFDGAPSSGPQTGSPVRVGALLHLHRLAIGRCMSTEASKVEKGSDSLLSTVFGGDMAKAGAQGELDDDVTADRHKNRHPKAQAMAEGKKKLKPWSGGPGGAQNTEHYMDVRTENVKILIGKRGAMVNSMMEESGAKIFISNQPGQDSSVRKVAIRGPADAIAKAKALIEAQIHYAETTAARRVTETVQILAKQAGIVIGKGGSTIKGIETESGATINIDSRNQPADGKHVSIIVSGTQEEVDKAVQRIEAVVADAPAPASGPARGSGSVGEKVGVPASAVASIIGKAGKNIRQLEAESGARIAVEAKGNTDIRMVSIWSPSGDTGAVASAKAAVLETVAQAARLDEIRHAGGDLAVQGGDHGAQERTGAPQRRSRMFSEGRERGRGRRGGGGGGMSDEDGRGGGEVAAALSGGASTRTTVSTFNLGSVVDTDAEVADLKGKGHALDDEACGLAHEVAAVLALNPNMDARDKRAMVRRFLKNCARPEDEARRVLEM